MTSDIIEIDRILSRLIISVSALQNQLNTLPSSTDVISTPVDNTEINNTISSLQTQLNDNTTKLTTIENGYSTLFDIVSGVTTAHNNDKESIESSIDTLRTDIDAISTPVDNTEIINTITERLDLFSQNSVSFFGEDGFNRSGRTYESSYDCNNSKSFFLRWGAGSPYPLVDFSQFTSSNVILNTFSNEYFDIVDPEIIHFTNPHDYPIVVNFLLTVTITNMSSQRLVFGGGFVHNKSKTSFNDNTGGTVTDANIKPITQGNMYGFDSNYLRNQSGKTCTLHHTVIAKILPLGQKIFSYHTYLIAGEETWSTTQTSAYNIDKLTLTFSVSS